jgi:PatG C-terminal
MERHVEDSDLSTAAESLAPAGDGHPPATAGRPGHASPSFVYTLGQIEPRFPSLAVEKEFAQVTGRAETAGLTDREALQAVLSDRANRYLARQLCWVFVIEGLETYLLVPRDPADIELLVDSVRSRPQLMDLDLVIGLLGPLAPPEMCNGLVVPVVAVDQVYSFDRDSLIRAIPRPEKVPEDEEEQFRATAAELFDRILQVADNAGATDEHRALNYLAVRYPDIYRQTAQAHAGNASLSAVEVRRSRLSGVRKIVDVIFSYTHRERDVTEKYFVRVDVTEEFPFVHTKLSPYYERL